MDGKFSLSLVLYGLAVVLFLLAAIGAEVGTFGIANLGLASLAAGLFMDRWAK